MNQPIGSKWLYNRDEEVTVIITPQGEVPSAFNRVWVTNHTRGYDHFVSPDNLKPVVKPPIHYLMYGEHRVEVMYRSNHESCILFENGQMQIVRDSELEPARSDEEIRMEQLCEEVFDVISINLENDMGGFAEQVSRNMIEAGYRLVEKSDVDHLDWIYTRLVDIHLEPENVDYSIKFREIIEKLK